ncbi:MAG: TIGR03087 family PEP-CTERM/XrtA system glycosyltransferase [Rhodospirillaceae bacterium]
MRILYVCHRFPFPPRRGGKIRPYHMIKHLSAAGHRVTVASLVRSRTEASEGRGLAGHCAHIEMAQVSATAQLARMVLRLPTLMPSSMGYFYSADLARRIRTRLAHDRYDLIFVHCSSVAPYVVDVAGIPKILDFGDMDSQKWLEYARYKPFPVSAGYWIEGRKLEYAEKRLARRFDFCTATTRAEWETLESYRTGVATDWFPNGVDTDYFAPARAPYDTNRICFVGRMDYYPNQQCMFDFCERVLPRLHARNPRVTLTIVGAEPSARVRALAKLPGVTVTGAVPDVRPYVQGAAVMVAPLSIARGTQNKILESMALGVPVITTRVAARGVDAVPGEHLLVEDDDEGQTQAVLALLERPAERARIGEAGRRRVQSHHDWTRSMTKLDSVIERCLARRTMGRLAASPCSAA